MNFIYQTSAAVALAVAAGAPVSAGPAQTGVSDAGIKEHIHEALIVDPRVNSAEVQIDVKDGYVTLSGGVHNLAGKSYAVSETEKIAGVKGIVDKLSVASPWRADADISQDVRHRIVNHSRIQSHGIGVQCASGEVKLTGEVDAYVEKLLAAELASEVRGVRKVMNDVSVRYNVTRSDTEVLNDVKSAVELDVYLTGLPIRSAVQDGHVTLQGSTGSWFTRRRAETTVRWIPGVRDVKNELEVVWSENQGERMAKPVLNDNELAGHVHSQLHRDSRIDATKIEVKAKSGGITLSGSTPSSYQKGIALEDAQHTVGVGWVTDKMVIGAPPRSDASIRADVLWELDVDYLLAGTDQRVAVKDGVVTLEGKLHSYYQKNHASELAHRIRGVKRVANEIQIVGSKRSDKEIRDSLTSGLKWNWRTYWVQEKIHVSVSGGTATLTGQVSTWAQRAAAARVAHETPGVWRVFNNLHVGEYPYVWEEWYGVPTTFWVYRS